MRQTNFQFAGLEGVLDLPGKYGRYPAIVCLHPASDGSADHFLFRHLARTVTPLGVGVLRFNRRQGARDDLESQASDALAAVDALRSHPEIDSDWTGLWGFSQGAWVAPLAASRSDVVAFLVLLASTGVSPAAQMRFGTAFHMRAAGFDEEAVVRMLEVRRTVERYNRGEVPRAVAQSAVARVAVEPWFPLSYLPVELPQSPGWWSSADFEPERVFEQVRAPTLLFYGEVDEWSPIDESIAAWKQAAVVSGNRDVAVVRLAGTGHHPTYGGVEDESAIASEYVEALIRWVRKITRPE